MNVFVSRQCPPASLHALSDSGWSVDMYEHDSRCPRAELIRRSSDADALIVQATDPVDRKIFEEASQLKVVACCSLGYDNVDLHAAKSHNVVVCNSPSPDLIATTAEAAVGLLLSVAKRISRLHIGQQNDELPPYSFVRSMGVPIRDRTCGIIGLGRIGGSIARIMKQGFNNSILYFNRSAKPVLERSLGAQRRTLDALLAESDFVFIAVPLNEGTQNLVSADKMSNLKSNAIIVNVAREGILDDLALVEMLATNRIFGAGLDVYESIIDKCDMPNLILTAHMSNGESQACKSVLNLAVDNVIAVLSNKPPISPVTNSVERF